jgi:hypothetical protein
MRYRLRTLLILMAVLPPLLTGTYWLYEYLRPKPPLLLIVVEHQWYDDLTSHPAFESDPSDDR